METTRSAADGDARPIFEITPNGLLMFGAPFPFGRILLLICAATAAIVSWRQTFLGMHNFFGNAGVVQALLLSTALSAMVQGGIFGASLYLSRQFLRNRLKVAGHSADDLSVSGTVTALVFFIFMMLALISVFFSYAAFYDGLLKSEQRYARRIQEAERQGSRILDETRTALADETKRFSKDMAATPEYKAWLDGIVRLHAASLNVKEIEKFLGEVHGPGRRLEALNQQSKIKSEIQAKTRILKEMKQSIEAAQEKHKETEKSLPGFDPAIQEAQEKANREVRGEGERPVGEQAMPGKGKIWRELNDKVEGLKQAKAAAEASLPEIEKQIVELTEKQNAEQVAFEGLQKDAAKIGLIVQPEDVGDRIADAADAARFLDDSKRFAPARDDLAGAKSKLDAGFDPAAFKLAETACRRLRPPLSFVPAFGEQLGDVRCEEQAVVPAAIRRFEQSKISQTGFAKDCQSIPVRPSLIGKNDSEAAAVSGTYIETVTSFATACLSKSQLRANAGAEDDVRRIDDRIAALQRAQGAGVDYLSEMRGYLFQGDASALMAFGIAFTVDSLILVFAFLSELVRPQINTVSLDDNERRQFQRAWRIVSASTGSLYAPERALIRAARPAPSKSDYRVDLAKIADEDDYRSVYDMIMPSRGSGGIRSEGKSDDAMLISERAMFDLIKDVEDIPEKPRNERAEEESRPTPDKSNRREETRRHEEPSEDIEGPKDNFDDFLRPRIPPRRAMPRSGKKQSPSAENAGSRDQVRRAMPDAAAAPRPMRTDSSEERDRADILKASETRDHLDRMDGSVPPGRRR